MKVRADVAAMIRAGALQRQIIKELGVGSSTIAKTRRALGLAPPPQPRATPAQLAAAAEERHPQVAAMLRAGATLPEITKATGVSQATAIRVRRALGIPARPRGPVKARTIAETLALYSEPHGDGHARWTGPINRGRPELWAGGRLYSGRREIYRAHHGRDPHGRVRITCEEPGCIAGPHLADDLDRQYTAIFGPDAP